MNVIAVDLGARYSRVATAAGGEARLIADPEGETEMPSWVTPGPDGSAVAGRAADDAARRAGTAPLVGLKRLMAAHDPVRFGGVEAAPAEVMAHLVRALRATAERALGEPPIGAVVAVPATGGTALRAAARRASVLAGLIDTRLIDEPLAAALAHHRERGGDRRVLVFSLGAGHFEAAVVEIARQHYDSRAAAGHQGAAGDFLDGQLADRVLDALSLQGVVARDPASRWLVTREAERAKIALARAPTIPLRFGAANPDADRFGVATARAEVTLTRGDLDGLVEPLLDQALGVVREALARAAITMRDVDDLLLVGGSTRLPQVAVRLHDAFGMDPVWTGDDAVARGAALYAASLDGWRTAAAEERQAIATPTRPAPHVLSMPPAAHAAQAPPAALAGTQAERQDHPAPPQGHAQHAQPHDQSGATSHGATGWSSAHPPAEPDPEPDLAALVDFAYGLVRERPDDAIALAQSLAAAGADAQQVARLQASAYHQLGLQLHERDVKLAIAAMEAALRHDERHERARQDLAALYQHRGSQLAAEGNEAELRALLLSSSAAGLVGDWGNALLARCLHASAIRHLRAQRFQESMEAFTKAFRLAPGGASAREAAGLASRLLAEQHQRRGDWKRARAAIEHGLHLDPSNTYLRQRLAALSGQARAQQDRGARAQGKRRRK